MVRHEIVNKRRQHGFYRLVEGKQNRLGKGVAGFRTGSVVVAKEV